MKQITLTKKDKWLLSIDGKEIMLNKSLTKILAILMKMARTKEMETV